MVDAAARPAAEARAGCLRWGVLALVGLGLLSCGVLGVLLALAARPDGLTFGQDALNIQLAAHERGAWLTLRYRFAGAEGPCARVTAFDLRVNPPSVQPETTCTCTVPDANFQPVQRTCTAADG